MKTFFKHNIKNQAKQVFCSIFCLITFLFFSVKVYSAETIPVQIQTTEKVVHVEAETAVAPRAQMIGLMYRSTLPEKSGMIFIFPHEKMVTMWMKNTYIPLDMIFFNQQGIITHTHQNAKPFDLTKISSVIPAIGVLEVNAGFVEKNHIQAGDTLSYPNIKQVQ